MLVAGCGDDPVPTSRSRQVAGGRFVEANVTLAEAAAVTASFTASPTAVYWDVHTHGAGGGVTVVDSGMATRHTIEVVAPAPGGYSLLWLNPGPDAVTLDVDVEITGDGELRSWSEGSQDELTGGLR